MFFFVCFLVYIIFFLYIFLSFFFFFFSSRRRHTRLVSDWSSDVCSSDLGVIQSQRCAFGEIESWAIISQRNLSAPGGLADAVASIEAVCARNVDRQGCHCEIGRASCRERV